MSFSQGRFTSPDFPFLDWDLTDPQSLNLYSYGRNNPLRNVDPTGNTCVTVGHPDGSTNQADDGDGKGCPDAGVSPSKDPDGGTTNSQDDAKDIAPQEFNFDGTTNSLSLAPTPTRNSRKFACSADVAINFGLGFIPGYNAIKAGASVFGLSFNPVQAYSGYRGLFGAGLNTLPQAAAGIASGYSFYQRLAFEVGGGASELNRQVELAGRIGFAGKTAASQASIVGKLTNISRLSNAASSAGTVSNLLNTVSAGFDIYNCVTQP